MKRVLYLFVLILITATIYIDEVSADGGNCTYRPPNKNEKAFFSQFAALRTAVPPAPDGWELREDEKLDPKYTGIPEQVCNDDNEHALILDLFYERKPDREKEDATLQRAQNAASDKAELAKIEPLQAKQLELAKQATAAAEKGDFAMVDKLNAEIDVLVQQIQKIYDDLHALQSEITAELERDRTASIKITVNGAGGDCYGNPQPIIIPNAVAYRCAYDDGYTSSGNILDHASARILIMLGQATMKTQDWPRLLRNQHEFTDHSIMLEATYDRAQPLVVHNVVILIDSDNPEMVDNLFRGMRLDGLKKLVRR